MNNRERIAAALAGDSSAYGGKYDPMFPGMRRSPHDPASRMQASDYGVLSGLMGTGNESEELAGIMGMADNELMAELAGQPYDPGPRGERDLNNDYEPGMSLDPEVVALRRRAAGIR